MNVKDYNQVLRYKIESINHSSLRSEHYLYFNTYYYPSKSKYHDSTSRSILDFKDGCTKAYIHWYNWLTKYGLPKLSPEIANFDKLYERNRYPLCFNLVHPLSSSELVTNINKPMSRICQNLNRNFDTYTKYPFPFRINYIPNSFIKTNHIKPLKNLNKVQRKVEFAKAKYKIHDDFIRSSVYKSNPSKFIYFLIIDDVYTTGTTMFEITQLIHNAINNTGLLVNYNLSFHYLSFLKTSNKYMGKS